MSFADLRQFLSYLEERREVLHIHDEVDPIYQLGAYVRKTSDVGGPALVFHMVKGSDVPVVGGVLATRRRILMAYGVDTDQEAIEKFLYALDHLVPTRRVETGVCQEVVLTGNEVDMGRLPIPTFSLGDGGPYITLGMVISKDPDTGSKNAAIRRIEVKGKNKLGIMAHGHTGIQQARAEARNQYLEVAIALGCDPIIPLINAWKAPYGVDELTLAGAIRGEPVEVVRCRTVDLEVPATAEIIIEGRIPPHVREPEGPFGEVTGYQTDNSDKQVVEVTAITHRRDPIYQTIVTGVPSTEHHMLKQIGIEATCYADLKGRFPGVKAVHFPAAGAVGWLVVVSMKQAGKYEARNVLAHLLSISPFKMAIVVDDDIDVYNLEQVVWAVVTRCQFDKDVVMLPRLRSSTLDPAAEEPGVSCGMGIDATRPFGQPFPQMSVIPGVDKVPDLLAMLSRQLGR
ncbi:MAG: UbiD family decarboxylase [Chloroflexi bacterium]|nr:UbiD family decarboxylase [Chloroflexota bacterium]